MAPVATNQREDVELELDYEIEEDVEAELEDFVRLNHIGQFNEAHELFDDCLSSHVDWYPVAAEYADCLLREGKFARLSAFSREAATRFSDPREKALFSLMELIGDCVRNGLHGSLFPHLRFQSQLSVISMEVPFTSLRDIEIHVLEVILQILALTKTAPENIPATLRSDKIFGGPCSVFKDWFLYLLQNEYFWAAQRVLQSLFDILPLKDCKGLVSDYIRKAEATSIHQESVQVALSSTVQRYIYVALTGNSYPLTVLPWNNAVTWAILGETVASADKDFNSLFSRVWMRRLLQNEPWLNIQLPLVGMQERYEISDSLFEAVRDGNVLEIKQELKSDANPYNLDEVASMALLKAFAQGREGNLLALLNHASVNAQDALQRTALHLASSMGEKWAVELLLKNGADRGLVDWLGNTALHYAVIRNFLVAQDMEVAKLLLQDTEIAVIDRQDLRGLTPLHKAVQRGAYNIAMLLLEHKAAVNLRDNSGLTPLDLAKFYGESKIEKLLISYTHPRPSLSDPGSFHRGVSSRIEDNSDSELPAERSGSSEQGRSSSVTNLRSMDPSIYHTDRLPKSRFAGLSPSTNTPTSPPNYQPNQSHFYPPANPSDQNPPCNTLYVGNLPIDASEDELKMIFSKQRGYKRLAFRTKQYGPMCFVEFEDVSFSTKALNELYGHPLRTSTKRRIRLSFAKNPLGVRTGPPEGLGHLPPMLPPGSSTTDGSPPGIFHPAGREVRRSKFYEDKEERSAEGNLTIVDSKNRWRRFKAQKDKMWTEITKDFVSQEAIEESRYEYEETEDFYYVMEYLRYEDVSRLVELSERIREIKPKREAGRKLSRRSLALPAAPSDEERIGERAIII